MADLNKIFHKRNTNGDLLPVVIEDKEFGKCSVIPLTKGELNEFNSIIKTTDKLDVEREIEKYIHKKFIVKFVEPKITQEDINKDLIKPQAEERLIAILLSVSTGKNTEEIIDKIEKSKINSMGDSKLPFMK